MVSMHQHLGNATADRLVARVEQLVAWRADGYDVCMKLWIRALLASSLLFAAAALWLVASTFPPTWKTLSAEMILHDASLQQIQSIAAQPPGQTLTWQKLDQRVLAKHREVYWLRLRLQAPEPNTSSVSASGTWGMWLALRAASEIYLDGRLLGRNGIIGSSATTEVAGQIDWHSALPMRRPTENGTAEVIELLIRASSFQAARFASADAHVVIGQYDALQAFRYRRWLVAALAYGAIVVACLYFVATQRSFRTADRSGRWLLALGAVGLVLPWLEAWRFLWGYSYPWHASRMLALQLLHMIAAFLLPIYLMARWRVIWRKFWIALWLAGFVCAWCLDEGVDIRMWLLQSLGLLAAIATMIRAPRVSPNDQQSRAEWRQIFALLISMLVLSVGAATFYLDGLYFMALAVLMISLLLAHTSKLQQAAAQTAQLQTERARLHAELLKRGMQPHWLLNTLTAMQELIEQQPTHASVMVERLAEEFQNLRMLSERSSITLSEEIALCRNHLALRELVHSVHFPWRVDGDTHGIALPPGLLHALIENAFTHAGASACARVGFDLRIRSSSGQCALRLSCALAKTQRTPSPTHGTGSAFIRASLQAAYPDQWQFAQYADTDHWIAELSWAFITPSPPKVV